jgi:hypothetical protein
VVEHAQLGGGLLLSTPLVLGSGLPVVVRFASGLRCVPRESLQLIDGSAWPGLPPAQQPEPLSLEQREASRWLETLRLGTVAQGEGELLTVGREVELAVIDGDLRATLEQGGACRVFRGSYGAGKSHLLAVLARRAHSLGLAVTRVVLDRQRVAAFRPRRLYREMVRGLSWPGSCAGAESSIAALLDRAVAQGCPMLSGPVWERHPYLTPLLLAWQALGRGVSTSSSQLRADLLYWIGGGERVANARLRARLRRTTGADPGPLYALKDHRTVWNQLTSLVTGWAALIRDCGLARGLVLILDEAEMCALESVSDQRHGDRVLTGLAGAALGGRAVRRPDLLRLPGGHSALRQLPIFHRSRSHLYVALGMATRTSGREALARLLPDPVFHDLGPLAPGAVARLLERILLVYGRAFPHFEVGAGFAQPLCRLLQLRGQGARSPRQIVQQAVAFLDGARLWPGSVEAYIEECLSRYD